MRWDEINANGTIYDVVDTECGFVSGPDVKEGYPISRSYQVGVKRSGSDAPVLRFRVDYTIDYLSAHPIDEFRLGVGDEGLHNQSCEAAEMFLSQNPEWTPEEGYVQGITAK